MFLPMCQYKDDTVSNIESVLAPPAPKPPAQATQPGKGQAIARRKVIRTYNRQVVFQAKTLQTEADIDDYVEDSFSLKQLLRRIATKIVELRSVPMEELLERLVIAVEQQIQLFLIV